jgi:hypothetical protein
MRLTGEHTGEPQCPLATFEWDLPSAQGGPKIKPGPLEPKPAIQILDADGERTVLSSDKSARSSTATAGRAGSESE